MAPSTGEDASQDAEANEADLITIAATGDVILDVTFLTSKETLRVARQTAARPASRKPPAAPAGSAASLGTGTGTTRTGRQQPPPLPPPPPPPHPLRDRIRVSFRVRRRSLASNSEYFRNLLTDNRFGEAARIEEALARLGLGGGTAKPTAAAAAATTPAASLPRVSILDDDEATRAPGNKRAVLLAELLRLLHDDEPTPQRSSSASAALPLSEAAVLVVLADRFDCVSVLARASHAGTFKFRWALPPSPSSNRTTMTTARPSLLDAEETALRQRIFLAWQLGHPARLRTYTRELIFAGSSRWSAYQPAPSSSSSSPSPSLGGVGAGATHYLTAAWWNLPSGLEAELQHRRECLLNALASIQRHFLSLYSSPAPQQCKLGYDSSAACDAFQLGQMIRHLAASKSNSSSSNSNSNSSTRQHQRQRHRLLWLVDLGPSSLDSLPDPAAAPPLADVLAALRAFPAYQIDRHHVNCGVRVRLEPILKYVEAMLAHDDVAIGLAEWRRDRDAASWLSLAERQARTDRAFDLGGDDDDDDKSKGRKFVFTRQLASDERLTMGGSMHVDRRARDLFTADSWDWTPEF